MPLAWGLSKEKSILEASEDNGPLKYPFVFNFPDNEEFNTGFKEPKGKDSRLKFASKSPKTKRLSMIEIGFYCLNIKCFQSHGYLNIKQIIQYIWVVCLKKM